MSVHRESVNIIRRSAPCLLNIAHVIISTEDNRMAIEDRFREKYKSGDTP
jgi:hypothetical protein